MKNQNQRFWIALLILMSMLFVSCGYVKGVKEIMPNRCDTVQGPSKLCEIASEKGINLSVLADGLGLLNIIAIDRGLYTKEQALKVLIDIRTFVNGPISYVMLQAKLSKTVSEYPYLLTATQKYLNLLSYNHPMFSEDQKLVKGWLDRLITGLGG